MQIIYELFIMHLYEHAPKRDLLQKIRSSQINPNPVIHGPVRGFWLEPVLARESLWDGPGSWIKTDSIRKPRTSAWVTGFKFRISWVKS